MYSVVAHSRSLLPTYASPSVIIKGLAVLWVSIAYFGRF
jgi:hypothetical protein